jgi:hypothetical protein
MELPRVIEEIACQADDLLAGTQSRAEARAGIVEKLNADYAYLNAAERKKVAVGVMAILEKEGFFEGGARSDGIAEDGQVLG